MECKYFFGLKDLAIESATYQDVAAFVSKPYSINGNVTRVSLVSTEEHPVFEHNYKHIVNDRCTSIEYYVSNLLYPAPEEWKPILPETQDMVINELLFFDTSEMATLNFQALPMDAKVYCNGRLLDNSEWTFASGCTKVSITNNYNPAHDYTIDYRPVESAHYVDFTNNLPKNHTEVFEGTDRNLSVTLSHIPYIDYEKINTTENYDPNTSDYNPVSVTLINSDIFGPNKEIRQTIYPKQKGENVYTLNKTNYLEDTEVNLNPYHPVNHPVIEYYQDKNKLYFTETFNKANIRENMPLNSGNADIQVDYQYISSTIRVKIILRRNKYIDNLLVTPIVKDFSLKVKIT